MGQRGFFSLSISQSKAGACRVHKSQKLQKVSFSTEHSTLGYCQSTQQNFRAGTLGCFPLSHEAMWHEPRGWESPHHRTLGMVQACGTPALKLEEPQHPLGRPTCIDKRTLLSAFSSCWDCKLMVASTGKKENESIVLKSQRFSELPKFSTHQHICIYRYV